jgi:hypothetical protein
MVTSSRLAMSVVASCAVMASLFVPAAGAQTEVKVVNTPSVTVPEPIPHSDMQRFLDVAVSSSSGVTSSSVPAGVVNSAGFTRMMLSLGGEVQGSGLNGTVGAVLIPVEAFVTRATKKDIIPFALRAEAHEIGDTGIFASEPFSLPVSFPQYAVFFYNTGERPVKANLYVYLTQ